MTFIKAYENINARLNQNSAKAKADYDFAVQVELTNKDCSGIMYIQNKDGKLVSEPYDYRDNTAAISVSYSYLSKLLDGRLNPSDGIAKGYIAVTGDASVLDAICGIVPEEKPAKKASAKKTAPKDEKKVEKTAKTKKAETPKIDVSKTEKSAKGKAPKAEKKVENTAKKVESPKAEKKPAKKTKK